MSAWSPTTEGFRTMFRRPVVSLAEVAWRWSFGAGACLLFGLGFFTYLDTLPVDPTDMLLLRTRQPLLIGMAFSHVFRGSALRVVFASVILFSALAFLWILLASLGRGVTLAPLLKHTRERAKKFAFEARLKSDSHSLAEPAELSINWSMQSLIGLNFLRAALALTVVGGALGATILAGFASPKNDPHPGIAFLLTFIAILCLWMIWSTISWFLSVAAIFVVRQGESTFGSLNSAIDFCRDRFGPMLAVGTWFGLAHLILFLIASSVVAFPFALIPAVPTGLVLLIVFVLTLFYFAIADTLHIGRLAGYIAILEAPPIPQPSPILPPQPGPGPSSRDTQAAMVDQDELILSDRALALDTSQTVLSTTADSEAQAGTRTSEDVNAQQPEKS